MASNVLGITIVPITEEEHKPLIKLFGTLIFPPKHDPPKIKTNLETLPPNEPDLSSQFRDDLGANTDGKVSLVFSKRLFKSDVNDGLARLSMPRTQILSPFLSEEEERFLQGKDENGTPLKKTVEVIDPSHCLWELTFVRWNYKNSGSKAKGSSKKRKRSEPGWSYMLSGKWRELVECNGLKLDDWVQVWAFRRDDGELRFAIVNVDKEVKELAEQIKDLGWGLKKKRGSRSRRSADAREDKSLSL